MRLQARHRAASPWLPAMPTFGAEPDMEDTRPQPTGSPNADFGAMELFKRALGPRTCGIVATRGVHLTCSEGYHCTNVGTARGCCATAGGPALCAANIFTTCLPYSSSVAGVCTGNGGQTLCCGTSSRGFCHQYFFSPNTAPNEVYTDWYCHSIPGAGILLDDQSQPTSTSSIVSSISAIATSTTTTATSSTAVPGNPPPLGAIIGGTVGGLAVVSLAVLAVLFFWRRASDSPKAQHSQSEVAASAAVAPGGEGYPKPPPNAPATMPWGVGGVAGAGRDGVHSGVPPSYGSGPSIGSPQSRVGSPVVSDYSEELKGPYQHQQPGSPQQPQPFQQGFQQVYQQQGYQQQGYIPPQPQPQNQGASTRWGMPSEMDSDYRG